MLFLCIPASLSDLSRESLLSSEVLPNSPCFLMTSSSPMFTNVSITLTIQQPREKAMQMNHCCHVSPYQNGFDMQTL